MKVQNINTSLIIPNEGQINGLPKNPRFIRDSQFEKLKKSIQDFPEMLDLRELILFPFEDKYIVIAGNMRLRAGQELGLTEFPCKILPQETTVERLKEITIKDNSNYGEWDMDDLANEWNATELDDWGVYVPTDYANTENIDNLFDTVDSLEEKEKKIKIEILLPETLENQKSEIQGIVKECLKGYDGIKIK